MHKILISGYYGFNNIGDDSILRALLENLTEKIESVEVTVLSQNPETTKEKYDVNAVSRKSFGAIIREAKRCDLLISGGGSLLQDATSKRSIIYYLAIMWIALLFRKKVFIYSQGMGPINSRMNRSLTAKTLKRVHGIVVRDEASKELLIEIGIPAERIVVTADPVIRMKPVGLDIGMKILEEEGFFSSQKEGPIVGFAIKERKLDSDFVNELCTSMQRLIAKYNARVVLIPFHYDEDMAVIEEIEHRLGGNVISIKHKYLTDEMLSIIGNMDVLVGVRLHALIYATIMNVPMIAISYDPKINSFMHSLDLKAMSAVGDFKSDFFLEEFEKVMEKRDETKRLVEKKVAGLNHKLDANEEMIKALMKNE